MAQMFIFRTVFICISVISQTAFVMWLDSACSVMFAKLTSSDNIQKVQVVFPLIVRHLNVIFTLLVLCFRFVKDAAES